MDTKRSRQALSDKRLFQKPPQGIRADHLSADWRQHEHHSLHSLEERSKTDASAPKSFLSIVLTTRKPDIMLGALPVFVRLISEYSRECRVTQEWVI